MDDKEAQARHVEGTDAIDSGRDVAKVVHADGTTDYVDAKAIGGDYEEMPKGYFLSPQFVGTVTVCGIVKLTLVSTNPVSRHNVSEASARTWAGSCQQILCRCIVYFML